MSVSISLKGDRELLKKLQKNASLVDVKRVVKNNGAAMQQKMQRNATPEGAFKKGYSKGGTQASIGIELRDNGLTAAVGPTTEYAPYVEFGTRFMDAEPFVRPALEAQAKEFRKDMKDLTK